MRYLPTAEDMRTLWAFARPHTIVGSILAVGTFYLVAAHEAGRSDPTLLAITLGAALAVNLYIVGLNQLTDVDIDRVNKPGLPLPSGRLSATDASRVVAVAGVLAVGLAAAGGRWLLFTILTVAVVGTLYSLPPMRLKRFPTAAALCIVGSRGVVGNFGLWLTFQVGLTGVFRVPAHVVAFVGFMIGFMTVISLLKDVPDIEGDAEHAIRTYSVRMGARRVTRLAVSILSAFYLGMIVLGWLDGPGLHGGWTVSSHAVLWGALGYAANRCDPEDRASVARCYLRVWNLYYLEFAAYLLACLRS